jgi:hypothetical protein
MGNVLTAYRLDHDTCPIVPAAPSREWMLETRRKNANRCLPLLMANQSGWFLLNLDPFEVTWTGGDTINHVRITTLREDGAAPRLVASHFGYGVITWQIPYLFRTPPGWNLVVRGPTNRPKDAVQALDGLVETDWAVATFTMNWKITRPNHPVRFDADEPFCMVFPQRRGELEAFDTAVEDITVDRALAKQFITWHKQREMHIAQFAVARRMFGIDVADEMGYQRHYFIGTSPGGATAPVHQQKLSLCPFHGGGRKDAGSDAPTPGASGAASGGRSSGDAKADDAAS